MVLVYCFITPTCLKIKILNETNGIYRLYVVCFVVLQNVDILNHCSTFLYSILFLFTDL